MSFRFRRRIRFGPLAFNITAGGLSSISLGGPGASLNLPVNRSGPARSTVGLPGTGISYSAPLGTAQRRQQQRPKPPTTEQLIGEVMAAFVGYDRVGDAFWRQGLIQRVLEHDDTPRAVREAALLIKSPEAIELHLRRARGPAATNRAAQEAIAAAQTVLAWTEEQGWSTPAEDS